MKKTLFILILSLLNVYTYSQCFNDTTVQLANALHTETTRTAIHKSNIYWIGVKCSKYSTTTNSWSLIKNMNSPREECGVVQLNGIIYAMGGGSLLNEAYNIASNTWTNKSNLPISTIGTQAVEFNNKIYIIGGTYGNTDIHFFEYDPLTDIYRTLSTIGIQKRVHSAFVVNKGKIYLIGGHYYQNSSYYLTNNVDEYDIQNNTWTSKKNFPINIQRTNAVIYDDLLYMFCGSNTVPTIAPLNTVYVYNFSKNSWNKLNNLPFSRATLDPKVICNRVYLIGGHESPISQSNKCFKYYCKDLFNCGDTLIRDTFRICANDSVQAHGKYFKFGNYKTTFSRKHGGDSIYLTTLLIKKQYAFIDTFSICEGDTIFLHNKYFISNGTFKTAFKSTQGCDSIYLTTIIVHKKYRIKDTFKFCENDNFTVHGNKIKISGEYEFIYKTIHGCDSIYTTTVKINKPYMFTDTFIICQGDVTYAHGTQFSKSGQYTTHLKTVSGCDSVYLTTIVVNKSYEFIKNVSLPEGDSLIAHNKIYRSEGEFTDTFKTISGCDSFHITNIKIVSNFSIHIPNVFSPNGDDVNNIFKPFMKGVKSYNMKIFNRWGELLFDDNSMSGWNGIYMNNTVQDGSYVYIIYLQEEKGRYHQYNGTVTVLK